MISRRRLPRRLIQFFCFAGAVVLLWPLLPWAMAPRFFAQASPFVSFSSSIAARTIGVGAGIGLIIAIASSLRKRWFCLYVCPTGFLLENTSRLGLRKSRWWTKCPPIGKYAAILTIVGSVAGYPVLLWMDPLCIFSSPLALNRATNLVSVILICLGLGALLAVTLVFGMVWCVRICPLSGTQDLLFSIRRAFTGRRRSRVRGPSPAPNVGRIRVARRAIFAGAIGAVLGLWARRIGAGRRSSDTLLRPPGAVPEDRFAGLCIRCNNCVHACPSQIIRPDPGVEAGFAGFMAPIVRYDRNNKYCLEECNTCTQVCPTGALKPMDLPSKNSYIIGEALVDNTICLVPLGKKECDACERSCPYHAIRIIWDEEQYVAYPVIDPKKCNGCGACEVVCPTTPVRAIRVWTLKPS